MRYVGEVYKLFIMLLPEKLTTEKVIDKIYNVMIKDGKEITKTEIKQALICRDLI